MFDNIGNNISPFLADMAVAFFIMLAGEIAYRVGMQLIRRSWVALPADIMKPLAERIAAPLHWLLLFVAASIAITWIGLPAQWNENIKQVLRPAIIGIIGWLVASMTLAVSDGLKARYAWKERRDNLLARRISTQLRVFQNTAIFFIIVLTAIAMAITIPGLRTLGISLFASAGVAGLVIGMAARPALSNLIAGVQLALTQPIRLDDVVIIEGEWGRIEEINATYVVVLIWDQRRLIVPLSYFIEHPFQNWTHSSSELLGTVFLYLDYTAPLDALREELKRVAEQSPAWDGRTCLIQVTDSKEQTLEVRALISAGDAGSLWNLRCEVREKLVDFLQQNHPSCLPRLRAEMKAA